MKYSFRVSFSGWYTTAEHLAFIKENPSECIFIVNKLYAVVSSSISFWIPCTIMLFTYYAIFREANRQEKQLAMRHGNAMLMHRHSNCGPSNNGELSGSGSSKTLTLHEVESEHTPTKDKHLIKMKREHKAARTLGIIMGTFNCLSRNHFRRTRGSNFIALVFIVTFIATRGWISRKWVHESFSLCRIYCQIWKKG
jgi:octopamine receptor beta